MNDQVRIDKWLWAARFYKTRSMASNAVDGGKVHVNQQRIKPSYRVKLGDKLMISRASIRQEVEVMGIVSQRRSANEAQELYREFEESIARRELNAEQRKILNQGLPRSVKKPGKHERQKIRRMIGKSK